MRGSFINPRNRREGIKEGGGGKEEKFITLAPERNGKGKEL